ncbi:MAG: CaiB/BaiF CoA transferase family protein [Pseudomonadales bacterium]
MQTDKQTNATGPGLLLAHLKVIDAASFLAGPGAATVLGDFGADVIKVEPLAGDGYRTLSKPWRTDYNWQLTSRNKRSIALDLNTAAGRGVMDRLVDGADVLVVNFFDDQLERYGLAYERLRARNPRLVYARISGYGSEGPEANRRGFDSTAWWARSGLMDLVRDPGQPPLMGAPGFGDHATAMSLFGAILLGLYRRELTGEGAAVETSLLANGLWANGMQLQGAVAGFDLGALRQEKGLRNPLTSVYGTTDGRHVLLALVNAGREWPALCGALDRPDWPGRYPDMRALMKDRDFLKTEIAGIIGALPLAEVRRRLDAADVTYSVVQNLTEALEDPQARAAGYIQTTGSSDPDYGLTVASPVSVGGVAKVPPGRAPDVGEHTRTVLAEAGFSAADIDALLAAGAVAEPADD